MHNYRTKVSILQAKVNQLQAQVQYWKNRAEVAEKDLEEMNSAPNSQNIHTIVVSFLLTINKIGVSGQNDVFLSVFSMCCGTLAKFSRNFLLMNLMDIRKALMKI